MKALVVYDSVYGNTEQIAQAIGKALGSPEEVQVVRISNLQPGQFTGLDWSSWAQCWQDPSRRTRSRSAGAPGAGFRTSSPWQAKRATTQSRTFLRILYDAPASQ